MKEFVLEFGYNKIGIGDLIIAKNPTHPKLNICKRVIGRNGHGQWSHASDDMDNTRTWYYIYSFILQRQPKSVTAGQKAAAF